MLTIASVSDIPGTRHTGTIDCLTGVADATNAVAYVW